MMFLLGIGIGVALLAFVGLIIVGMGAASGMAR